MDNTEHLVTLSTDPSASSAAELRIDIRSLPYLVDHGFQDMRVVPGRFMSTWPCGCTATATDGHPASYVMSPFIILSFSRRKKPSYGFKSTTSWTGQ